MQLIKVGLVVSGGGKRERAESKRKEKEREGG